VGCGGVNTQLVAHALRVCRRCQRGARHVRSQCALQRRFFLHLAHGAANPVHISGRGRPLVRDHPRQQVGTGSEAFAVREDLAQAVSGTLRELGEQFARWPVAIAEQGQAGRQAEPRLAMGFEVGHQRIVQQHQAREVQALEHAERQHGVVRVGHAGLGVHRTQQRTQGSLAPGRERRHHHEVRLWCHRFRTAGRSRSTGPCPSTPCRDRSPAR
jgi:hypothetical protein